MRFPGFIGPSYTLQSVSVDCQRCVNLYLEMDEAGTGKEREVASLVGTPGLKLLSTIGSGPIRGAYTVPSTGVLYVVSGNTIYSVDAFWNATSIGSLITNTGAVSMADNGLQLVLVDGNYGYSVTLSSGAFAQITDPNFLGATTVTFQDGYFIYNKPGTNQFYLGPLRAVTPFDGTMIGTKEGRPDNIVGLVSNQRNLFVFGSLSTEIFYDSGDTFPFARIQGAFIPIGCMSAYSIASLQDAIYWVGQDEQGRGVVYRTQGYQAQRISTHAVENVLRSVGAISLSSARAWTYQQGGHGFYCLSFPGGLSTWVYDTATNLWHERAYLNQGDLARHRADCHAFAYSTNVVGDYQNGNIYALDPTVFSDNSAPIQRMRAAPHMSGDMNRLFHSRFQLDMEVGVGVDGGSRGSDPQVILQFSDDGGKKWSNEKWASAGAIGATKKRVIWRRLGASRDRVYRIIISDPIKVTLIGAEVDAMEGMA